jgi:hypothetical protein
MVQGTAQAQRETQGGIRLYARALRATSLAHRGGPGDASRSPTLSARAAARASVMPRTCYCRYGVLAHARIARTSVALRSVGAAPNTAVKICAQTANFYRGLALNPIAE